MRTRQIRVKGRVQGVGYRDALRDEAQRIGVTGWVRNRADGSVEALLQGDAVSVERLIDWARRGPILAEVRSVDDEAPEPRFDRPYAQFERWATA
ncbi:MAG TPA: acylphosphatase [Burkholderiales bacterium]|nr:acylphosphatase [Burkholderiales bacterium]